MILLEAEEEMARRIDMLKHELAKLRTGRANPALLEQVHVDYYGVETPLSQIGKISVPEPNQLLVKPYDKSMLKDVEHAINAANLGINPNNEGEQLRIVLPALTQERRKLLTKDVHKFLEESKIAIRNARRHANDQIKKMEKDHSISEDDSHGYQDDVQELTDRFISEAEEVAKAKEQDIMTL
jgi:ribosome recycling factor